MLKGIAEVDYKMVEIVGVARACGNSKKQNKKVIGAKPLAGAGRGWACGYKGVGRYGAG